MRLLNLKICPKINTLVILNLRYISIKVMFGQIYKTLVIDFSKITIVVVCCVLSFFLYFSKDFRLDASSDSLLLESDKDLKYLREINERYGSNDYLVLTYTPISSFTDPETIINLQFLKSKIERLEWVDSVVTVIDVPLFKSSDEPLMERLKNYKTLSHPEIDKERGFEEILNSPVYRDYVISTDGKTSGIVVYLKKDKKLNELIKTKNNYFNLEIEKNLNSSQKKIEIFLILNTTHIETYIIKKIIRILVKLER